MRKLFILAILLVLVTAHAAAQVEVFKHVKIHERRSDKDQRLVNRVGTLTFDNTNRKFIFEKEIEDRFDTPERIEVPYDAVAKIVFETTSHMHAGVGPWALWLLPIVGSVAKAALADRHVHDYWFYFEYKNGDEYAKKLLEVPKGSSERVIEKAKALFGSRVHIPDFREEARKIKPDELLDIKSKQSLKVDKQDRPLPEERPDKATVVVVCPPLSPWNSWPGNQFKLHANDRVVAVNREGTYSFAYLDPGKYRLVSQSENASGFEMELEAGKTYYFLQNIFQGAIKDETGLTRNSAELVTYLMSGTYFSEWERKK